VILARAPLRLTLGGGGTDLPSYYRRHGGLIVAAAIDKYVRVLVNRPAIDDLVRVAYPGRAGEGGLREDWTFEATRSPAELRHELARPAFRMVGVTDNVEIVSTADVPAGTGLGSSASYLVALLAGLHALNQEPLSRCGLAELAIHVEADLAGRPVGKQDHYLAAFGGLTYLRIGVDGTVQRQPLLVTSTTSAALRRRLVLFFTGIRRRADTILAAQRDGSEQGDPVVLESLHRTKDLGVQIRQALEAGDLDGFGVLLHEHWQTKRRRSDRISDARVDRWYEVARQAGALGGKLVGAGGGGFLAVYCPEKTRCDVVEALTAEGLREMPYGFDTEGVKVVADL
jgi:D-glycero-alpha-D-manno-heptose-7-phosphate kinase